jgi:quercetin dioxygenase-like cupin family protein
MARTSEGGAIVSEVPLSRRPSEFVWKPQPALSKGAEFAVLLGNLSAPGRYVFRLRVPEGHRALPHTHPDERIYTVLSGTFWIGWGEEFDEGSLEEYPEGSVILVRAGRHHYQAARNGGYVVQVEGEGPTAVDYVRASDDPRAAPKSG